MTTVAVLGAGGYLGTAILAALSRQPVTVRWVGRRLPVEGGSGPAGGAAATVPADVRIVQLDQPGAVARAVAGSDVVINLVADLGGSGSWRATRDRQRAETVDVGILRDLIEFAGERPGQPLGVIFASTTALNVASSHHPSAERTTYERHKQLAESILDQATADGVLRGTSLRLPTLYGVSVAHGDLALGDTGRSAVHALIGQALTGGPVTMWGTGRNQRNLLHIDDAAAAFVAALWDLDLLAGRSWDVGAESGLRLRDLASTLIDHVAVISGEPAAPLITVEPPAHAAAHDLMDAVVDPRPFTAVTGWRPVRRLPDALHDTVRTLGAAQEMSTLR